MIIRLEIMSRVVYDFQCSSRGIEVGKLQVEQQIWLGADASQAALPVLLAFHEWLSHRPSPVESDEPEDMWGSAWEDFKAWVVTSPTTLLLATVIFSSGTYLSFGLGATSTYFCSALVDQRSIVILFQWLGIVIDATIIIMLWRVLSWARTTRARLRILCGMSLVSSVVMCFMWLATRLYRPSETFQGLDTLYLFDVLSTGIVLGLFFTSTALWVCESSPVTPVATYSFVLGIIISVQSILLIGTYRQITVVRPFFALSLLSSGFTVFLYANNMRSIIVIGRAFLILLLGAILVASMVWAPLKSKAMDRHPVGDLVYKSRISADRWLRYATISSTLTSAIREYKDRYHGRDPPPNFDKWFDFAQRRNSPIIDKFDQIDKDILPFWGMDPQRIQDGLKFLEGLPDVGIITITDGNAHHNQPSDPSQKLVLDDAVSMISVFSEYLPSMSIAINLNQRPRVLVPWEDVHRMAQSGRKSPFSILPNHVHKRQVDDDTDSDHKDASIITPKSMPKSFVLAQTFRHLQALACRPGSPSRAGVHWNVRDFCASCAGLHSQGQFLSDWQRSLDQCFQPDIFTLHDFYTTPYKYELYHELLPLFSRSKTNSFSDILIPLVTPDSNEQIDSISFDDKINQAFWQGDAAGVRPLTHQSIHGGQRQRLVHLANNASSADSVPLIVGIETDKKMKFHYEDIQAQAINGHLPLRFSFTNSGPCESTDCLLIQKEFGFEENGTYIDKRYAVLLDSSDGPPPDLLPVLRSNSVLMISSIFQEWYTDRLTPWVHFIPIDLRYHGLHSTLSYFIGLKYSGQLNGRPQVTENRKNDARWIAEEGRKWANKAIRREDMEVYLFRLLLEWGRVIDNDRDSLGFSLEDES